MSDDPRRWLPSVAALLERPAVASAMTEHGRGTVVSAVRQTLDELRTGLRAAGDRPTHDELEAAVLARLRSSDRDRIRPVINATGVVLHTNLGRAPLSRAATDAVVAAAGACTVEYDLATQQRASRGSRAHRLLRDLVGAEDALVVNNGAAALVLALTVVAGARRVAVSRGELVEIGGSFRLPSIIEAAGVGLTEVGTTNRTHVGDYLAAGRADPDVVAILRVHPSNFRIEGFTHVPTAAEVADAAAQLGVPFLHDVGSGLLVDDLPLPAGPAPEPSVAGAITDGADLVIASGDKLLGGPQAGLIVGVHDLVQRCRKHPLARALRVDKLRLAALEATLDAYRSDAPETVPVWAMLTATAGELRARARGVLDAATAAGLTSEIVEVDAVVGGGSSPGATLPSVAVAIDDPDGAVAARLVEHHPPIITRTREGRVLLDLRSVRPDHDAELISALQAAGRAS